MILTSKLSLFNFIHLNKFLLLFPGTTDTCQLESFNTTCGAGEVIVMVSARYGRMRAGRCITGNYGKIGCEENVLSYLDKKCSGHQRCTISVPDPNLHKSRPCPRDFTSYLETTYQCVRGQYM